MANNITKLLIILAAFTVSVKAEQGIISPNGHIDIFDNEALKIINADAKISILASGFTWTEGPVWYEKGGFLLFSDIPNNKVYKLTPVGDTAVYLFPSGYSGKVPQPYKKGSNGLAINTKGELILMQQGDRMISKMNAKLSKPKPDYSPVVSHYSGKRLNSPNDLHIDKQGNIYFTDPPYGIPKEGPNAGKDLSFQGVYCYLTSGNLILLDSLTRPNGIALSPNEKTLFVAVSDKNHAVWYQYDVIKPGVISNKRIFYDATKEVGNPKMQGLPDGMKVNNQGYIFATGPGGVWIFNESAKPLALIYTGEKTSNCAFDTNQKILYMTCDDYIMSVELR